MRSDWRARASRLRWRLRGGTMWPAFALLTIGDGVLMHLLPPVATGVDLVPGIIIASFANLFLIGAVAPWLARRLVARREAATAGAGAGSLEPASPNGASADSGPAPPAPYEVVLDRMGTGLLVASALGLLAAGLASRPLIVSETEATELNARAVRAHVFAHGSAESRRNVDAANTIRLAEGYFRTCVPNDDRRTAWCLFVDTNRRPPEVREDASPTPNDKYAERGGP